MELLGALLAVLGFIGLAKAFDLLERNLKVIQVTRSALSVLGDKTLDDLQKEKALQKNAAVLLRLFLEVTGTSLLALGIPLGLVWAMDAFDLLSWDGVLSTLTSTWFILAALGFSIIYLFLTRAQREDSTRHTSTEQSLHNLAFETWFPRLPLAKFESWLNKKQLADISADRPVFITALPRAGTTLTLEICAGLDEFATHIYGDMPFLLTPVFWDRFSKNFKVSGELSERVHGDGVLVNEDSPESFEEILWKEFWPSYYKKSRILPWSETPYPDFEIFFRDHMRKIILLRRSEERQCRYISKNNQNIARIGYLASTFPDSTILILYRSPVQHAASLLKQHRNFLRIHTEDSFAHKYMEDTGHFDFGKNLRPVDFKGWLAKEGHPDPDSLEFWLLYWINTYRYLLNGRMSQVRFFSFDDLCADPQSELERLGEILEVKDTAPLLNSAVRIRKPKPHHVDRETVTPSILERAEVLYRELQTASSS